MTETAETPQTSIAAAMKLEAARHYLGGLSTATMHRMVRAGELKPIRRLRHLLFAKTELDRWITEASK